MVEAHAVGDDDVIDDGLQPGGLPRRVALDAMHTKAILLPHYVMQHAVGGRLHRLGGAHREKSRNLRAHKLAHGHQKNMSGACVQVCEDGAVARKSIGVRHDLDASGGLLLAWRSTATCHAEPASVAPRSLPGELTTVAAARPAGPLSQWSQTQHASECEHGVANHGQL